MTSLSDYGTILSTMSGSVASNIAGLISLQPPAISSTVVDATNHGSSGWVQKVSSNLRTVSDLTGTFDFLATAADSLYGNIVSGCAVVYRLTFPQDEAMTFTGIVTNFAPKGGANANAPELLTFDIAIAISGSVVWA